MAQADLLVPPEREDTTASERPETPAAGLFGFSIENGRMQSFRSSEGYLRDIEQMPNFAPPSMTGFVAQYVASNIGRKNSSS